MDLVRTLPAALFLALGALAAFHCVPVAAFLAALCGVPLGLVARRRADSASGRHLALAVTLASLATVPLAVWRLSRWEAKFVLLARHGERLARRAAASPSEAPPEDVAAQAARWRSLAAADPRVPARLELPSARGVHEVVLRKTFATGDYWHFRIPPQPLEEGEPGDWAWPDVSHMAEYDPDRILGAVRERQPELPPLP